MVVVPVAPAPAVDPHRDSTAPRVPPKMPPLPACSATAWES
jgi:hypothetical protein